MGIDINSLPAPKKVDSLPPPPNLRGRAAESLTSNPAETSVMPLVSHVVSQPENVINATTSGGLWALKRIAQGLTDEKLPWQQKLIQGVVKPVGRYAADIGKAASFGVFGESPSGEEYGKRLFPNSDKPIKMPLNRFGGDPPYIGKNEPEMSVTTPSFAKTYGTVAPIVFAPLVKKAAQYMGKDVLFKSGFNKENAKAALYEKKPPYQVMWEHGKTPLTAGQKESAAVDIMQKQLAARNKVEDLIRKAAPEADVEVLLKNPQAFADELITSKEPVTKSLGLELQSYIDDAVGTSGATGKLSYDDLLDYGDTAAEKAFTGPDMKPGRKESFFRKVGGAAKEERKKLAESLNPDYWNTIDTANQDISSLATVQNQLERAALADAGKKGITQVDAMVAALDPHVYAAKQAGKILGTTGAKTVPGRALYGYGEALPYGAWLNLAKKNLKGDANGEEK